MARTRNSSPTLSLINPCIRLTKYQVALVQTISWLHSVSFPDLEILSTFYRIACLPTPLTWGNAAAGDWRPKIVKISFGGLLLMYSTRVAKSLSSMEMLFVFRLVWLHLVWIPCYPVMLLHLKCSECYC